MEDYREIINIGILAHVDAGKTSITEQMLYKSGVTRSLGNVDKGTS
ncbi:MAG: GTP-binding protein, partial [Bacteroidetes bacterium]|nr:GTP-binding protein [Bacteroidota bacterium]MBU1580903.1 GTP-binding protein [Bacteroidota bacterium]